MTRRGADDVLGDVRGTIFRGVAKLLLAALPRQFRATFARLPNTRVHWMLPWLLRGKDVVRVYGAQVEVEGSDLTSFHALFFGKYEEALSAVLLDIAPRATCYADVGANIGLTALPAAVRNEKLRVHAFEPDPVVRERLAANARRNAGVSGRFEVWPCAASDENGVTTFIRSLGSSRTGQGRILEGASSEEATVEVPRRRLDGLASEWALKPDLVKIDVEGHELHVLRGMKGLFEMGLPKWIVLEMHPGMVPPGDRGSFEDSVFQLLKREGFKIEVIGGDGLKLLDRREELPGNYHVLASREDGQARKGRRESDG